MAIVVPHVATLLDVFAVQKLVADVAWGVAEVVVDVRVVDQQRTLPVVVELYVVVNVVVVVEVFERQKHLSVVVEVHVVVDVVVVVDVAGQQRTLSVVVEAADQ